MRLFLSFDLCLAFLLYILSWIRILILSLASSRNDLVADKALVEEVLPGGVTKGKRRGVATANLKLGSRAGKRQLLGGSQREVSSTSRFAPIGIEEIILMAFVSSRTGKTWAPVNLERIQNWIDQGRLTSSPKQPITARELLLSGCIHDVHDGVKVLGDVSGPCIFGYRRYALMSILSVGSRVFKGSVAH
jgi:hypothetical protein